MSKRIWQVNMKIGTVKATGSIVKDFTSVLSYIYNLIWMELNLTLKWPVLAYART